MVPEIPERSAVVLRDLTAEDRQGFVAYQMDPRYRRLYDYDDDPRRAHDLFDLFMSWQAPAQRRNFQYGIFDKSTGDSCGCAGVRQRENDPKAAVIGIELSPANWGRFGVAVTVIEALIAFGFDKLNYHRLVWETSSGSSRVEKLSRWFGARLIDRYEGAPWMSKRGWDEVLWALNREDWQSSAAAAQARSRTAKRAG